MPDDAVRPRIDLDEATVVGLDPNEAERRDQTVRVIDGDPPDLPLMPTDVVASGLATPWSPGSGRRAALDVSGSLNGPMSWTNNSRPERPSPRWP